MAEQLELPGRMAVGKGKVDPQITEGVRLQYRIEESGLHKVCPQGARGSLYFYIHFRLILCNGLLFGYHQSIHLRRCSRRFHHPCVA